MKNIMFVLTALFAAMPTMAGDNVVDLTLPADDKQPLEVGVGRYFGPLFAGVAFDIDGDVSLEGSEPRFAGHMVLSELWARFRFSIRPDRRASDRDHRRRDDGEMGDELGYRLAVSHGAAVVALEVEEDAMGETQTGVSVGFRF